MVSEHSLRMFLPYFIVIAVRYAFGCPTPAISGADRRPLHLKLAMQPLAPHLHLMGTRDKKLLRSALRE